MLSSEFKSKLDELIKKCDKKRFFGRINDDYKGMTPTLKIIYKNQLSNIETTAGDISNQFDVSTARVAKILNCLEEKKYITRRKSEKDLRKTIVEITDLGIERVNACKDDYKRMLDIALKDIDDEDIDILFKVFSKMIDNLNEIEGGLDV